MQGLVKHYLILLVLHLYLCLIKTELLKKLKLLLLTEVLIKQQFGLLPKELHLCDLI